MRSICQRYVGRPNKRWRDKYPRRRTSLEGLHPLDDDDDDNEDDVACRPSCNVRIVFVRFLPKSKLVGNCHTDLKYKFSRKSFPWQCPSSVWRDKRTEMTRLIVAFRNVLRKHLKGKLKKAGKCFL